MFSFPSINYFSLSRDWHLANWQWIGGQLQLGQTHWVVPNNCEIPKKNRNIVLLGVVPTVQLPWPAKFWRRGPRGGRGGRCLYIVRFQSCALWPDRGCIKDGGNFVQFPNVLKYIFSLLKIWSSYIFEVWILIFLFHHMTVKFLIWRRLFIVCKR